MKKFCERLSYPTDWMSYHAVDTFTILHVNNIVNINSGWLASYQIFKFSLTGAAFRRLSIQVTLNKE